MTMCRFYLLRACTKVRRLLSELVSPADALIHYICIANLARVSPNVLGFLTKVVLCRLYYLMHNLVIG
jgi:hypothetical protein